MKRISQFVAILLLCVGVSCSSTQSLQEYYVDSSENPNFLSFDIPSSILNLEAANLTSEEKEAVASLRKLNVLAFKKTLDNALDYKAEKTKVKAILKNENFNELMRMNTPYGKATVKYLGDTDAIDEVIVYGDSKEKGFVLIRVLGNDMKPENMMQLIEAIQKSDYNGEGLGPLEDLLKS